MNNGIRTIGFFCALGMMSCALVPVAMAESEMPRVVDIPLATEPGAQDQATGGVFTEPEEPAVEKPEDAPAGEAAEAVTVEDGDSLVHAQQMLIDLGYLNGSADGIYGPMTRDALMRFQKNQNLEATGTLDDETMGLLDQTVATTGDARAVQQRLIDLGYLKEIGRAHV